LVQDGEVAYDILIFDITTVLQKLCTPTLNTQLLDESPYQQLIGSGHLIKTMEKQKYPALRIHFWFPSIFSITPFLLHRKAAVIYWNLSIASGT
jgi:hypothetical protein